MAFSILIAPRELELQLQVQPSNSSWILFDCRHSLDNPDHGLRCWSESHLPGAQFADINRHLSGPKTNDSGRHPLPDEATFRNWLGEQGVSPNHQVVAYDDSGGIFASRLWWLMKALGHESVAVLDGGLEKWLDEKRPVDTSPPKITPGSPYPNGFIRKRFVNLEEMVNIHIDEDVMVIDARGASRYSGREEPIDPVAGHIPGAINLPFSQNLAEDGSFLPKNELQARFREAAKAQDSGRVIHYCGSGVTACHNILAMTVAGYQPGLLFPGSWSQWCSDPERKVKKGETP